MHFPRAPPSITETDVVNMLHKRFYRHHNISLNLTKNKIQLNVHYSNPKHDPKTYNQTVQELTNIVNKNGLSNILYYSLYRTHEFPDYTIINGTDVIEFPCQITLDLYDASEFYLWEATHIF